VSYSYTGSYQYFQLPNGMQLKATLVGAAGGSGGSIFPAPSPSSSSGGEVSLILSSFSYQP
jgi:hypothetical protein